MSSVIPNPDPIGLPAPAWLLQILLVLTFVLHLLAMNLLVGGVVMMGIAHRKGKSSPFYAKLAERLSMALPPSMAMTITLGIAPLLFLQVLFGQAFYTTSILMAWPWLAIIPLLIVSYYGLYIVQYRPEWLGNFRTAISWLSALIILFIGLLFTSNSVLIMDPSKWGPMYAQSDTGLRLEVASNGLWARYLHSIVAGFAISGLGLGWLARRYERDDAEWSREATVYGGKWFVNATLVNLVVGMWFLFSIPREIRMNFLGESMVDTGILWLGVLIALGAMHFAMKARVVPATLMAVATVALMAVSRHRLRAMFLDPDLDPTALKVSPQWDVFAVFVVLLLAGLVVVGWMLHKLAKGSENAASAPEG
ncbi:MAG TPA: hypothetical protein PLX06_06590 [Fimbriimonadaceae bacterium]|nr:hypothetical protein [Fimbriimonadaceae bacterium]